MSEKIKEILDQLKDSFEYPKFEMPTFDGSDFDYVDNDTLLEPDKCKILLDYINNLQNQLQQKDKEIERLKKDNEYLNKVNIELSTEKNRLNNKLKDIKSYLERQV